MFLEMDDFFKGFNSINDGAQVNVYVKVIPNAKHTMIKEETGRLKVYLTQPAVEGKANKALLSVLAQHYGVKKRQIVIIKGLQSRVKTISINGLISS